MCYVYVSSKKLYLNLQKLFPLCFNVPLLINRQNYKDAHVLMSLASIRPDFKLTSL